MSSLTAFPATGETNASNPPLPSLANTGLLIGHGEKADLIWTRAQFLAACRHMLNGNAPTDFLLVYPRCEEDLREPYAKSKKERMEKRAAWAWDYIRGHANNPAGIGFYPSNPEQKSRWAAMDFDSHDGNVERARHFALTAFQCLLKHPDIFLILSTSGRGWHLFIFSAEFHSVEEWTKLLRQVASLIGAPIQTGILEIFPDEGRGLGKAIRAPGTWNPKRNGFSLVCYENVSPLLSSLCVEERVYPSLYQSTNREKKRQLIEQGDSRCETALRKFAICEGSTRHDQLAGMVAELYRFYSRAAIESLARRQFAAKTVETQADAEKHMVEFGKLWDYWLAGYRGELTVAEIEKETLLATDAEKEAFRLAWGFARLNPGEDFAYSTGHFRRNLGISIAGVCKQRQKFCALGILRQTARFVANISAARFRWIADA